MIKPYQILIADDHQMFIDGIKLIFSNFSDYEIVAEALSGKEVLDRFKTQKIDIAILDVNMPKPNGFETCKLIKKQYPNCKIMILTMYAEGQFLNEFIDSGASAYVLKNAGKAELLRALESIVNGQVYIGEQLKLIADVPERDGFSKSFTLTKRELEIIALLAKEKTSAEIADTLFISTYTVNTHRKNILNKLDVKNTAGLIKYASENGIV